MLGDRFSICIGDECPGASVCAHLQGCGWGGRVSANKEFFARRRAAAAFKHAILDRYPLVFAVKAGSVVAGGRVMFLDGYAGPGPYDDGTAGSPLLFVQAAKRSGKRNVLGVFVERDPQRFEQLKAALDDADRANAVRRRVVQGDLGSELGRLLPVANGAALFVFLDPFGTALDAEQLVGMLRERRRNGPTEVLLHFSVLTIARIGAILRSARGRRLTDADRKTIQRADAFLGGDWWHDAFAALADKKVQRNAGVLDEDAALTATDVAMSVAESFCRKVRSETGYRPVLMPVRPEPGKAPKYVLVLFTRNDHGIWYFADTLGHAGRQWQAAVLEERARADAEKIAARFTDQECLFGAEAVLSPPFAFDQKEYDADNRERWVSTITANLHHLLVQRSSIRLVDHVRELYGDVLGQAREMHVRAAVKALHASKTVADPGTGDDFWHRTVQINVPNQRAASINDELSRRRRSG